MDTNIKSAAIGAVASGIVAIAGIVGLNLAKDEPSPQIVISPAEATATVVAAPLTGVSCPQGWVAQFGGAWQQREDGRAFLACDLRGEWNLTLVNDGSKVLTRYKGGPVEQYVQTVDGGEDVDARVSALR